jgi:hypothetical protein
MDTSFWKNLSKDTKIQYTTKQYFKQYLYKLEIYAPGCKSIRYDDIKANLQQRQSHARSYSLGGGSWWNQRLKEQLKEADLGLLVDLKRLIHKYADIKVRIEEPKISFYAESESMLQCVALAIGVQFRHQILCATGPESDVSTQWLQGNAIIVNRQPKFRYRVYLKEKRFDIKSRTQVHNYLQQLGDLVKLPKNTTEQLTRNADWMWNCYFYTNDAGVANLVRIINPDIIREVCELVYIQE